MDVSLSMAISKEDELIWDKIRELVNKNCE